MSDQLTEAFRQVLFLRRLEEKVVDASRTGSLDGTVLHSSIGQEAVAVGVGLARQPGDLLVSTHRGMAHCIAWGCDPTDVIAESFGHDSPLGGGLVGHMHLIDPDRDVLGTNGVVGGGMPLAVGAALATDLRKEGAVVVCFFGDGATNTGNFHESINLAGIWGLPVLFVCENNRYQEMTLTADLTAGDRIERARSYGMEVRDVDGADVGAVLGAATELIEISRTGGGPTYLECEAFRVTGHWTKDSQHYRSDEERASFATQDPLARLLDSGLLTDAELEAAEEETSGRVEEIMADALGRPRPDRERFHALWGA